MPYSTDKIPLNQTSLIAFVGPADCGKTYASTSYGLQSEKHGGKDKREALVLECDGRIAALRSRPVLFEPYTNEQGAAGICDFLKSESEQATRTRRANYHTYILSSATSFGGFAVQDSMEDTQKGGKGIEIAGQKMLEMQDYNYEAESFRKLIWVYLTDLKRYANCIVEFHEVPLYKKTPINPGSKMMESTWDGYSYKLLLHGDKIASRLPTKFDEIYHFKAKEPILSTGAVRRAVSFDDNMGRTSIPALRAFGSKAQDISGKEFWPWWNEVIMNGQ